MYLTRRILRNAKKGAVLQFSENGGVTLNNNLAMSSSSPVTMSIDQTFNIDGADAYFSNNINTSGSLSVAEAATLSKTLTVTQGSTLQGTLDVTGESIFTTNTTVSGTLKAENNLDFSTGGGSLKAGSLNALTVNSSGEVTKIGQDTPGEGEFLKWDSNNNKVVWDAVSVTSLSLDSITAANNASTRIENSGDLHLDSTAGELFLSSSNDFTFISSDTTSNINFQSNGLTSGKGHINLQIIDRGNDKSLSQISLSSFGSGERGLTIKDGNNDISNFYLSGFGTAGAEITNSNEMAETAGFLHIGTINQSNSDRWGQYTTGSLLFSATDRRFIFCDSGKSTTYSGRPKPFFHIKKNRSSLEDLNTNFEVELNATKGQASTPINNWNDTSLFTHSTFLKFNQDGQITKLGHDTPTDGQVLSWDNTNGYVVWSTLSVGSQTLSGLTDTDLTTTAPTEGDYLKYVGGEWVPADVPISTPTYLSTTNSPITAAINYHYSINTTIRPVVINLPQVSTTNRGKRIIIKFKKGNNFLTTNPYSGETIEENNNFIFAPNQSPGQSITLVSDGVSNWEII